MYVGLQGEVCIACLTARACGDGVFAAAAESPSLERWLSYWLFDVASTRFDCLLVLLAHGASLTEEQMAMLHSILKLCADNYEVSDFGTAAIVVGK